MDTQPQLAWLSPTQLERRARWDASAHALMVAMAREPMLEYPPHRTVVGGIAFWLASGQSCEVALLSTGKHCRSYGAQLILPGGEPGAVNQHVMGADQIWSKIVSPGVRRFSSIRHFRDLG